MSNAEWIEQYAAGPDLLVALTRGLSHDQARARPILGRWSTLEVICHLADFEIVYADRLKRVIAEHEPTLRGGDPDQFAARLAYHSRDLDEELRLIAACRGHVSRILRTLTDDDFRRVGQHSEAGPLSLQELLQRVTNHAVHHGKFIEEKRRALGLS
jgi:uncharacterized damage-inducible protein DinB